ncbi:MAG: LPS assembly lipoprotein LptE [Opitutales bacterium]
MRTGGKAFPSLVAVISLFPLLFFSACSSYVLGPVDELPFRTLYVEAVSNDSLAPQAASLCSVALREAFLRDGRVKLASSAAGAEATLSVRLTNYRRRVASYSSADTARANSFEIILDGEVSLSGNRADGKILFEGRSVQGTARLGWSDSKTSPDGRQPLAAAIRSLSLETVSMSLDTW